MEDDYLYSGTKVLKNKLNIKDAKTLEDVELLLSKQAIVKIQLTPIKGDWDKKHLDAYHKAILGELYDFAGKNRTIDMMKGEAKLSGASVQYVAKENIQEHAIRALRSLATQDYSGLKDLSKPDQMDVFAKGVAAIWRSHPYREGNTRTITRFALDFAKEKGFPFDEKLLAKEHKFIREALVVATVGQSQHLTRILTDARSREITRVKHQNVNAEVVSAEQNQKTGFIYDENNKLHSGVAKAEELSQSASQKPKADIVEVAIAANVLIDAIHGREASAYEQATMHRFIEAVDGLAGSDGRDRLRAGDENVLKAAVPDYPQRILVMKAFFAAAHSVALEKDKPTLKAKVIKFSEKLLDTQDAKLKTRSGPKVKQ